MRCLMLAALFPLLTGGCVGTVVSTARAPFRAVGQAADWATTSRDEADRNAGRRLRRQEARDKDERRAAIKACRKQRRDDCDAWR